MINMLSSVLCALLLTGCATGTGKSGQFSCPAPKGMGCKSISQIDKILDGQSHHRHATNTAVSFNNVSERTGEKILDVWLASQVDAEGAYHAERNIKLVVKPSEWQMQPVMK